MVSKYKCYTWYFSIKKLSYYLRLKEKSLKDLKILKTDEINILNEPKDCKSNFGYRHL